MPDKPERERPTGAKPTRPGAPTGSSPALPVPPGAHGPSAGSDEGELRKRLLHDPSDAAAVNSLATRYASAQRWADLIELHEQEAAALEKHASASSPRVKLRRAGVHLELGKLWEKQFARIDRALTHYQRSFQCDHDAATAIEALEAARRIYRSLGDDEMVARLYELELEVHQPEEGKAPPPPTSREGKARLGRMVELLTALGRLYGERLGDLEGGARRLVAAAQHADEAGLTAQADKAREALAEVYASPDYPDPRGAVQAVGLLVGLSRARLDAKELPAAEAALRRALGVDPTYGPAAETLLEVLERQERWDDLERLLRQRAEHAPDEFELARITGVRARVLDEKLGRREGAKRCYEALLPYEEPFGPASRRLRELYTADGDHAELLALAERETPHIQDPNARIQALLELSAIAKEKVGDRDKAAEYLHEVLAIDPGHPEALARYADHFRDKRDWRGLADLSEFAVDAARDAGAPASEIIRRLEELAQVSELRLGDVERAIGAWRRVEELDSGHARARESVRRLLAKAKMWESLVRVLEKEAEGATGPAERSEALKRIAQVYRERQVDPRRAIALYEEALQLAPLDPPTLKALAELYEREGDDAGLASALRRQVDLEASQADSTDRTQIAPEEAARDSQKRAQASAARGERIAMLRRLSLLYDQRLSDLEGVVWACSAILELLPGDRDALDRLERVLTEAEDSERLEQTLEYHVQAASGASERAKVLRRLAELASSREVAGDTPSRKALERWEKVREASPNDLDTLDRLATLYEGLGAFAELSEVLERSLDIATRGAQPVRPGPLGPRGKAGPPPPPPGANVREVSDPALGPLGTNAGRLAHLRRLARVVDTELGDDGRALKYWQRVQEAAPADREALEALTRLYENKAMWRDLAEVLARRASLETDKTIATELALTRTDILEERLGAPDEAVRALEVAIAEVDPQHLGMHARLRRLYEIRGDIAAAVRIAERELYLARVPQVKVARGLEIGVLCRDRLGDPRRALGTFERVLELDPGNLEALRASADLYGKVTAWDKQVTALETLHQAEPAGRERRALGLRIAAVLEEQVGDPRRAFEWLRKTHKLDPDPQTLAELGRAADAHGLYAALADVYEEERNNARTPAAFVAACRELATIAVHKLRDPERALEVLQDALDRTPADDALLAEAEKIAQAAPVPAKGKDDGPARLLLEIYGLLLTKRKTLEARLDLLGRRARWYEDRLKHPSGALDEYLRAFALAPDRPELRTEILRLGEASKRMEEALACEATLFARAPSAPERFAIARRAAALVEDKVGDKVRAFRAYLRAFRLRPDDDEVTSHLWRLAKAIGPYPRPAPGTVPAQRVPAPAPPPPSMLAAADMPVLSSPLEARGPDTATDIPLFVPEAAVPRARPAPAPEPEPDTTQFAKDEPTDEVDDEQIWGDGLTPPPMDPTDLIQPRRPARADQTMDLSPSDLASMIVPPGQGGTSPLRMPGVSPQLPKPPPAPMILSTGRPREDATQPLSLADLMPAGAGRPPPAPLAPLIPPPPPLGSAGMRSAPPPPPAAPFVKELPPPPRPAWFESPWEEFAHAYESLPVGDLGARLRMAYRAAELWERGPGDISRAFETLERALAARPGDAETRARLERLAEQHEAWSRLAALYERLVEHAGSVDVAAELQLEVGRIREIENLPAEAEEQYRSVLGIRPGDPQARARLETLFVVQERWADLAASMEERADPRSAESSDEERPSVLRELAEIYDSKLARPYEAASALERLRDLAPDDESTAQAIAALYERLGRWAKAVEALSRLSEITPSPARAYAARKRVAEIYEHELELSDRAIEAWAALAEPEAGGAAAGADARVALEALDRLYEASGRWAELENVLARRVALAPRDERPQILKRRALVQAERLGRPDDAAATLREARALVVADKTASPELGEELGEELVRILIKAGRAEQAAEVLADRARGLAARKAPAGEQAAIWVRLATLRASELDDADGARADIERALALVPSHPSALAELTRLSRAKQDPRAFAEARLREGIQLVDDAGALAALLEAGATLRDELNDAEGAKQAFQRALSRDPGNAEATWALAALAGSGGNVEEAARILEARLDTELEPPEHARILTELSALAARAGAPTVAERRLEQALAVHPHLPAALAMADLLDGSDGAAPDAGGTEAREPRWQDLADWARTWLPRMAAQPGIDTAALAGLYRRAARAFEQLGRDDDAYSYLLDADRLHHGQVLLKLAMGENRYRARRWREAALHLGALAELPGATRWPREVAEGLCHAALAEVRAMRADRAPGLYEAALRLSPECIPALRALAEQALERGDDTRAIELMRRQADATADGGERVRLFEAVGDLTRSKLHDEAGALACYQAALDAASPVEARHVSLLDKLSTVARQAGELPAAARALELLASFAGDAATRAARHRGAAELRMAASDLAGAREQAARALEGAPPETLEATLELAVEIEERAGDAEALAQLLGRMLPALPAVTPGAEVGRAQLWATLGRARMKRGDSRGAAAALEKAAELEGADLAVRRDLVKLYEAGAGDTGALLPHLMAVVEADPLDANALRTLARAQVAAGQVARARVVVSVLEALSAATAEDRALVGGALTLPPVGTLGGDEPLGTLDAAARQRLLGEPLLAAVEDTLAALFEAPAPLFPHGLGDGLGTLGVALDDRILPTADHPLARAYPHVLRALAVDKVVLYVAHMGEPPDVAVACAQPTPIAFGARLTAATVPIGEVRFALGRGLELARPEHVILAGTAPAQLVLLFDGLALALDPRGPVKKPPSKEVEVEAARLRKALPPKAKVKLEQLWNRPDAPTLDARVLAPLVQRVADRAGVLMSDDTGAALRAAQRRLAPERDGDAKVDLAKACVLTIELKELLSWAVSARHFEARELLGIDKRKGPG